VAPVWKPDTMNLKAIVLQSRKAMAFAFALVVIENVAWIIEPTVFGQTIDALIENAGLGFPGIFSLPLLIWMGVFATNTLVGSYRRVFDQKVYLHLFTDIATAIATSHSSKNIDTSTMASRTQLSREIITFFQYRMPEILEQIIAIGGAVIGIALLDWRIAAVCFSVLFPLTIINTLYTKRVTLLQTTYHDRIEDMYEVFEERNPQRVNEYFSMLIPDQLRIARWGARSFLFLRGFLLLIFIAVLYISIDLDQFSVGDIYTIVAYLWTFVTSTEYVPELMESYTSLADINRRLKEVG
jgi:ABC-type multidrug transport system fused ATPase/permease subunit